MGEEYVEHLAMEYSSTLEEYRKFRQALRFQMDTILLAKPEYQRMSIVTQNMPAAAQEELSD